MYCPQFSIYYQETILGIQEQCLSLGKMTTYEAICNIAARFMFKKGQLLNISHITEGKQCEWGIFLISLWLGLRKASPIFEWAY